MPLFERTAWRALLLAAVAAVVAACVVHRPQPSPQHPPPKQTAPIPKPVPAPAVQVFEMPTAEQDKAHKQELARSGGDVLAPAEVGYFLDVLQGRLQQSVDPGVIIGREGDSVTLDLSRRIGSVAESGQLSETQRAILASLAKVLVEYRATFVSVRVRAENTASHGQAKERARVLARSLVASGLAAKRVVAIVQEAQPENNGGPTIEIQLEPLVRSSGTR